MQILYNLKNKKKIFKGTKGKVIDWAPLIKDLYSKNENITKHNKKVTS